MGVNEVKWFILRFLLIKEVVVLYRNKVVEWIGDSYIYIYCDMYWCVVDLFMFLFCYICIMWLL